MDIVQIISNLGFPIACVIGMAFWVKNQITASREDIKDMQREHKEEISKMSEAWQNNTIALNNNNELIRMLCQKMEVNENEGK